MQSTVTKLSGAMVYTTVASTDLDRAEHFYRDILGLDTDRMGSAPENLMVHCGHETGLSVYERPDPPHCDTTLATFVVGDLSSVMDDLRTNGVTFEEYDLPYLKTTNGIAEDSSSKAAWFRDPDGNILSVLQMK